MRSPLTAPLAAVLLAFDYVNSVYAWGGRSSSQQSAVALPSLDASLGSTGPGAGAGSPGTTESAVQAAALAPRHIDDWELTNFVLVSTVDGGLQARDRSTGVVFWSLVGAPLLEIEQIMGEWQADAQWIAEPSDDGGLLYFNPGTGIERVPLSIRELVERAPFAVLDNIVYTGSRKTTLYTVDTATGNLVSAYGSGSPLINSGECLTDAVPSASGRIEDNAPDSGTLVIGRTEYTLEIHEKVSSRAWKLRYSYWGSNARDTDLAKQYFGPTDNMYVTPINNGTIMAMAKGDYRPQRWVGQVPATMVKVFDVLRPKRALPGNTTPLVLLQQPPFNFDGQTTASTTDLYIDQTPEGDLFALSGIDYAALVTSTKSAAWCVGAPKRFRSREELSALLIGVHPNWCQHSPINTGSPLVDPHQPPRNTISGPQNTDFPRLPPPPPFSWWRLIIRFVENVLAILVLAVVLLFAVRQGWVPGIIESLDTLVGQRRAKQFSGVLLEDQMVPNAMWEKRLLQQNSSQEPEPIPEEVEEPIIRSKSDVNLQKAATIARTRSENALSAHLLPSQFQDDAKSRSRAHSITSSTGEITETESAIDTPLTQSPRPAVTFESPQPPVDSSAKRRKRGSRGGKKVREAKEREKLNEESSESKDTKSDTSTTQSSTSSTAARAVAASSASSAVSPITVSEDILGYGSHGTIVLKGTFENRDVAVKRMLLNFYDLASQEVNILQESDDHPNVVRYFCKHQTEQFLFIALELCPGTLEDILHGRKSVHVPYPVNHQPNQLDLEDLRARIEPLNALKQIASGVHHLHSLKIVHRDIKPQNILVANPKEIHVKDSKGTKKVYGPVRLLISDFGLCKKLEGEQSSFQATTAAAAGTAGWTAPEISMGSRYTLLGSKDMSTDVIIPDDLAQSRRLTRAVDIFSLGCVFYYVLSPGVHPFGENYVRQLNIEKNEYDLSELDDSPYGCEAKDLISRMIAYDPRQRLDTSAVLSHPLFWTDQDKLDFLVRVSDRLEHDTREEYSELLAKLEAGAANVVGSDWHNQFPQIFIDNLGKYRKYHGDRIIDLLRALRNKLHHYNDFSPEMKLCVGSVPSGYLSFFTSKFPLLFMEVYHFVKSELAHEDAFLPYFTLPSTH